jgi:integrase
MKNQEIINDYIKFLTDVKKAKNTTIKTEQFILNTFNKHIKNKPFKKVQEQDIISYLKPYSESTYDDRLRKIKTFYNWLFNHDKSVYPDCIKRIQPNYKSPIDMYKQNINYRERVITEEEYQRLLDNTYKVMHKAMIETLYLFGCRASELLNMNSNNVTYDGEFTRVTFTQSKTEPRDNVYQGRAEHLLKWVESYQPFKDQPNKPLWITPSYTDKKTGKTYYNTRFTINGLEKALRVISKRAEIKNITPHDFRHTRTTIERRNGTPQTHIESNLGYTKGTSMMQVYDHNKTKDYENYLKQKQTQTTPATYELLKKQKETIEEKHEKEINVLQKKMEVLEKYVDTLEMMKDKFEKELSTTRNKGTKKEETIQPAFYDDIVQDVLMRLEKQDIDVKKIIKKNKM